MSKLKSWIDPFVVGLILTVTAASLLPCRGQGAILFGWIADAGIMLLFFLHGAKLSREAILAGIANWKVHLAVLATSFGVFPLLGLAISHIPGVPATVGTGMLFLTLLPSTVQSSIAFTAIAGGNVAAAVCAASLSNLLGIFVTPALVTLTMHRSGAGVSADAIWSIATQLLLPFVLGHLSRRWTAPFLGRHKSVIGLVDRGAILLVVYTAFSAAVVEGIWHKVSLPDLGLIVALSLALLGFVLALTFAIGRIGGFPREDGIVIQFCGSKKSLVSGVPMAGVLFAPAQVGLVLLPVMIFHQLQLFACAIIARGYAKGGGEANLTGG